MPINTKAVTVGTSEAVQLVAPDNMPQHVWIHDHEHSSNTELYLGGPDVGTATGLHMLPEDTIEFELNPGDEIWAISGQGSPKVRVMSVTKVD